MCSFLFAQTANRLSDSVLATANIYAKNRGPDQTTLRRFVDKDGNHLVFLHNLLDISGNSCTQPISSGDKATALFNGELYNFRDLGRFDSDTECIIPAYLRDGLDGATRFDGEFSIVVYDHDRNAVGIFTDPFLTKPLHLGQWEQGPGFAAATCASSLKAIGCSRVEMAEPNASYSVRFNGDRPQIQKQLGVFAFSLDQHKDNYDDWNRAFLAAVGKRALHGAHRPMVFLSSGYDSGAICLALNMQNIEYDTFSIVAGEKKDILDQRIRVNRSASCGRAFRVGGLSDSEVSRMAKDIEAEAEPFVYVHEDRPGVVSDLQSDGGALGANFLAALARRRDRLVNLSGSGADEIMSDYGFAGDKFYYHSEFGGLFPEQLESIFPWKKFYGDTQRSYLFKDEFILGRHGIEGRYPFLDKQVVQEFLWLTPALKNGTYKGAIAQFLAQSQYPFEPEAKRGFSPRRKQSTLTRLLSKVLN